jgi:S1-C subfamily serine protease
MVRLFVVVLALMISLPGLCAPGEYASIRAVVYPVRIKTANTPKGTWGNGSAILIKDKTFITSAHLFQEPGQFFVQVGPRVPEDFIPLKIIKIDYVRDLALITADVSCPCATLATSPPLVDEEVVVIGYPYMRNVNMQIATQGRIQGITETGSILSTANIAPGNSGGGMFVKRDEKWYLIGVSMAVYGQTYEQSEVNSRLDDITVFTNWIAFTVPIDKINDFLKSKQTDRPVLPGRL